MEKSQMTSSITFQGIAVSPGIQIAKIHLHESYITPHFSQHTISPKEVSLEKEKLTKAIEQASESINKVRDKVAKTLDEAHAAIFDPQLMILQDPMLLSRTNDLIENQHKTASQAFMDTISAFADQFASIEDAYIASRKSDIMDVANRVCKLLSADRYIEPKPLVFDEDVIVIGQELTPSDTAQMDHSHVKGFATELGGPTSHTAILAKALEIPAIVGIGPFVARLHSGMTVIIDGYEGTLTVNPSSREIARSRSRRRRHMVHERDLQKLKNLPAETIDGYQVELGANVELPIEIPHVKIHGASGVGLLRTEFQYLESNTLPGEEALYEVYKQVLEAMAPQPVIIRTIDLGGDKLHVQLNTHREMNPFLGLRAIRLCLAYPDLFRTQLRAILRASVTGNSRIMFPMISSFKELRQAKDILESVREELRREGTPFSENVPVGIMIETPSAAICADQLAKEVDFFSIGTNDLIQYTLAVDRGNEQVASLYDPFNPAILRLIRMTIDAAQREGIWVGLCGEMSANPLCALLLVGLGINELSMGAMAIPEIKRLIRQIRLADARRVVEDIFSLRTSAEIHDYVRQAFRILQRRRMKAIEKTSDMREVPGEETDEDPADSGISES